MEIFVDKDVIYSHPEKQYDLRQTVELFDLYKHKGCEKLN